jgi:hypothetical protein
LHRVFSLLKMAAVVKAMVTARVMVVLLWAVGSSLGCGISTHTEIGQRALHLLGTHPTLTSETIR